MNIFESDFHFFSSKNVVSSLKESTFWGKTVETSERAFRTRSLGSIVFYVYKYMNNGDMR